MSLPYTDPSLPSAAAPIFSDLDAVRGDHLRANNSLIWSNLNYLEDKIESVIAPVSTENLLIYQSDSTASVARFTNSTTTTVASHGTEFGIDASEQGRIWNYENTDLIIGTNNTTRLNIKNNGQIGIGTDTPAGASQLNIYRNDTDTTAQVRIDQAGTGDAAMLFALTGVTSYMLGIDNSDSDKFKIDYGAVGVGSNTILTIDSSRNIGIGASPSNRLHIQSTTIPQFRLAYDGSNYLTISNSSTGIVTLQTYGTTKGLRISNNTGSAYYAGSSNDTLTLGLRSDGNASRLSLNYDASHAMFIEVDTSGDLGIYNQGNTQSVNITNGGVFTLTYGRWPSGNIYGTYTDGQIFTALDPYIPNVNDEMIVSGGFSSGGIQYITSRALRYSSTVIYIYCHLVNTAAVANVSFTSGGSSSITMSLAF